MKLKTKLIPFVGVAAACSAVVPLVVSCGKGSSANGFVSLTKQYKPTIEQLDHNLLPITTVNSHYTKVLSENLEVFLQDYYWYSSLRITSLQENLQKEFPGGGGSAKKKLDGNDVNNILDRVVDSKQEQSAAMTEKELLRPFVGEAKYHDIKISNLTVEPFEYSADGQKCNIPVLSFDFEYKYQYDYSMIDDYETLEAVDPNIGWNESILLQTANGKVSIKDVPFVVYTIGDVNKYWRIIPIYALGQESNPTAFAEYADFDKKWSITVTEYFETQKQFATESSIGGSWTDKASVARYFDSSINFNNLDPKSVLYQQFNAALYGYATTCSYYLYQIGLEK